MVNNTGDPRTSKKKKIFIGVTAILLVVVSFLCGFFVNRIIYGKKISNLNEIIRIMENVGFIIDENGNPRDITEEEYADALVNGILDKYSRYFTQDEYRDYVNEGKGNSTGTGLTFFDTDCVIDKISGNSPAEKAGVKAGDKILSFEKNQVTTNVLAYADIKNFVSGVENNVEFEMKVLRGSETLSFTLIRTAYKVCYVNYYDNEVRYCFESENNQSLLQKVYNGEGILELPSDVAYITFSGFEGTADTQLFDALNFMKMRGRTKLIFDLRGNGGGYMNILTQVAGGLIEANGKNNFAVAVAESKNNKETFYSGKNRFNTDIQSIVVLADKRSASASECLIGAMIHYGGVFTRDKLIIEKDSKGNATTYGKGIMQTTYGLKNGGALKLTTARILWPDNSTCIHGVGITTSAENSVEKQNVITRALEII